MASDLELDPVHTRHVILSAGPFRDGRRHIRGRLIDLRHRGVSRVAGRATGPGLLHDMTAEMVVDAQGRIAHAGGGMKQAPFEARAETRFEGCRDILGNVAKLAGACLDDGFARRVSQAIGGQNGCYHLTTLIRAMEPLVAMGEACDRTMRLEGWRRGTREAVVRATLEDAAPDGGEKRGRAFLGFEVRLDDLMLCHVQAEHRAGPRGRARSCPRASRTGASLSRLQLIPGFARGLTGQDGEEGACSAIVELAFGVSAVASQILFHLVRMPVVMRPGTGGRAANTCVMWREGGPLEGLPVTIEEVPSEP